MNHFIIIMATSVICWMKFFTSSGSFVEWGRAIVMMIIMMCLRVFNPSPSLWWLVEDSCGRSSDHKSKDQLRFKSRAVVFRFEKKMKKKKFAPPTLIFVSKIHFPSISVTIQNQLWMFFFLKSKPTSLVTIVSFRHSDRNSKHGCLENIGPKCVLYSL